MIGKKTYTLLPSIHQIMYQWKQKWGGREHPRSDVATLSITTHALSPSLPGFPGDAWNPVWVKGKDLVVSRDAYLPEITRNILKLAP